MIIGILILMIGRWGCQEFYHHYILRSAFQAHDYLENLSQNPSWI